MEAFLTSRKVAVQPPPEQPPLPFDIDPREADRAERADRMRAAGLRPPQRYLVIPEDHVPPVPARGTLARRLLGALRLRP